jgi:hypothetical protein
LDVPRGRLFLASLLGPLKKPPFWLKSIFWMYWLVEWLFWAAAAAVGLERPLINGYPVIVLVARVI